MSDETQHPDQDAPDVVDLLSATVLDSIKVARGALDAIERVAGDREAMVMAMTLATGLATELLTEVRSFVGVLARAVGEQSGPTPPTSQDSSPEPTTGLIDLAARVQARQRQA